MSMLTNYNKKNYALILIKQNISLFNLFNNVYLFGSILNPKNHSHDIDILLIYSTYSDRLIENINRIYYTLNNISKLPVDITALSITEENEIDFLKKQNLNYFKVK